MSEIRIIGPDGSRFVFPAGTSREVMLNAMRRRYTGQERREREQTRDMILNSQLPGPGRAGVQEYLSRDQMRQDLAQARETNIAAQESALIPEDTTRERFYTGAQGVTLGAAPLIQGAAVAPMAALLYPFLTDDMRGGRSLGEFVSDMSGGAYQRARTDIARAREERPIESLALETAGGLFTGKTAYDALGERFLRNRAAARGGVVGTGAGAQYGFLESEGDPGQTAQAAGIGGLFGAPVGKAIEGIADIGGRMFQRSRGMEAPEPVAEPEVLPAPEPGRGYLGRRVFDNPPRQPNPRTEAERATWAPTATVLEQARTRASEAKAIADQTLQTRRPEDIARVKDQKKALIADIEATMAQREGMNTPDDQRLADALSALSMETSDPVFISTQLGVAQRNLDQVMINQGMRPEPMRTPVQTVPPFRPTPSREQQARTIEGRPSRTRYAGGTPQDETPMGFNANTAIQAGLGSAGGSVAGSQTDLNGDGVIDMQDVAIGSVMGGVGLPLAGRAASRLDNALAGNRGVRGMGFEAGKSLPNFKANPKEGQGFDEWLEVLYSNEMRGSDNKIQLPNVFYRGMSDAEFNAAQSAGVFKPISGDGLYVEKDPTRYTGGGAYGAKRGGYIVQFDTSGLTPKTIPSRTQGGFAEDAFDQIPINKIARVWKWDPNKNDHVLIGESSPSIVSSMGFGGSDLPKPVQQARQAGYQGADTGESKEWLSAIRKGLRMDTESRMARAREMGFDTDTVLYHGSISDIQNFKPSNDGNVGPGVYLTSDIVDAESYARFSMTRREKNLKPSTIYPLYVRGKIATLKDYKEAYETAEGVGRERRQNAQTALKNMGFAGIEMEGYGDFNSDIRHVVIFDPSNIRSVHAAFDPTKSGSSELLAAAPFVVGGVGVGTAMQENDQ